MSGRIIGGEFDPDDTVVVDRKGDGRDELTFEVKERVTQETG
jgi:hypothetical protein